MFFGAVCMSIQIFSTIGTETLYVGRDSNKDGN